jgi:hypothetical protein
MLGDLTAEQHALALCMSDLSEEAYCAGWMVGLEFALWQIVVGDRREYGRLIVTDAQVSNLRSLAEAVGGWIVFDDDREETWVSTAEWDRRFQAWQSSTTRTEVRARPSKPEPSNVPYSRDELRAADDGRWPERGDRCLRCGVLVPRFADLKANDRARLIDLIGKQEPVAAMDALRDLTGAPTRFAKIWVLHSGSPQPRYAGPPCPHCGERLASERAKQCLHCHADWH